MKPYRPFYIASALFTLLMLVAGSALAVNQESFKWHGDYRIFYSAFGSTFLSPEVAVANQMVRGKDRGIVNIAVVEQLGTGTSAEVTGVVQNIFQQTQTLKFTEIREQGTLYYLAPFKFDNEDLLTFKIRVLPGVDNGSGASAYQFKFQKKLYHD